MKDIKRIALIPAYNPDTKLLNVVRGLNKQKIDVVVIDDGSDKSTDVIFDNIKDRVHLIYHDQNMGKGAAIKTGLTYIKENYTDEYIVVTMDCDGQHTIEDTLNMFYESSKNPECLIVGARTFEGDVPTRSRIGNNITKFIFKLVSGVKVSDTQTGLRAFNNTLVDKMLDIPGDRYEYEINVLLQVCRDKIKIIELPIKTIYFDNNSGSHFKVVEDSLKIYKSILKFPFTKK